jgi:O-antigen/teichoic acid export membrane protein
VSGTLAKASSAVPWSLLAKALRFGFSLAASMLVVRLLSPESYGELAIVRTALAFAAAIVGLGMGNAIIRFLPERETAGAGSLRLLRFCGLVQGGAWALFLALAFALRGRIDALYGTPIATPLVAGLALLSGNLLFSLALNALNASFQTKRLAFLQGILSAAILLLTWGALRAGFGVIGVLAATSVPQLFLGAWAVLRLRRSLATPRAEEERSRVFRYAVPLLAIEILNLVTWRQSETLLLGHFRSAAEAGVFDVAYRLPQLLLEFVPETIWPLVLAAFVEVYTRDRTRLAEMTGHYFRLLFLLVTPITLFGALYGDTLIRVLYGAEWDAAGPYARVFFVIFFVSFFGTPYSMALYLIERTGVNLALSALFAAVNIGLDLALIPKYGLPGAVPGVALAVGISPFLRAWAVRRYHGPVGVPWRFIGRCSLASASMLLLLPLRRFAGSPAGLLVLLAAAVMLFLVSVRLVGLFGSEERALLERSRAPGKRVLARWLFPNGESR